MTSESLTEPIRSLGRDVQRLASSFAFQARDRGLGYAVGDTCDFVWAQFRYPFATRADPGSFTIAGRELRYVMARHNRAWRNERTVELALGLDLLESRRGTRTLEVGNVMSHYTDINHVVVDEYEMSPSVINEDIVEFRSDELFETILSISTLEHIGWDERPRESDKTVRACNRMRSLLEPGGELLLTCPIGQNKFLDQYIYDEALPFEARSYLRRVDSANTWEECSLDDVRGSRYGEPFRNANALFVGRMLKPTSSAPLCSAD